MYYGSYQDGGTRKCYRKMMQLLHLNFGQQSEIPQWSHCKQKRIN